MQQSSRRNRNPNPKRNSSRQAKEPGAWLPWPLVEEICRLNLRPPSVWQVFLAVLLTSARYGGREARLEVVDLARLTGLGERTVQLALTRLIQQGLLLREGRYGRLKVPLRERNQPSQDADELTDPRTQATSSGSASLPAPPKRKLVCASPTCLYVFISNKIGKEGSFTDRQRNLIVDVLTESSELLGSDATDLCLPSGHAERLGLSAGVTYGQAYFTIAGANDARKNRDFTRIVQALRHDIRVQGEELDPSQRGG